MSKKKTESFFWVSYSDMMTSLFFIMLLLFVLSSAGMYITTKKAKEAEAATKKEIEAIKQVVNSTKELDTSEYYKYKPEYKKYVLNVRCYFDVLKSGIEDLQADRVSLKNAGEEIESFLRKNAKTQYLLIIEGQASRNSTNQTKLNYDLSFQRAFTLMKFWKDECKIDFGVNCEIQIAGSGDGRYNFGYAEEGSYRFEELDNTLMRERGVNETENQRFVIHIIPKNIMENGENSDDGYVDDVFE